MWVDPLGCCDSLVPSKLWIVQWSPCVSPPGHPQKTSLIHPSWPNLFRCYRSKCYPWLVLWYICCCCPVLNPIHRIWRSMVSVSFDNSKGIKWLIQKKTWISHWMDIAADHWKDQDQIRFHLRRKTRPWSSSIRPTHLILVTDNFIELIFRFSNGPMISLCLVLNQNH